MEEDFKTREEGYEKQKNQMRENYKESPQKKLMDEQVKKFKTLAENMQKRHSDMMEDSKQKNEYIQVGIPGL